MDPEHRGSVRREGAVHLPEIGRRGLRGPRHEPALGHSLVKRGGRDRDLVEKGLLAQDEPERDDSDALGLEGGLRQVARRIRHDGDAPALREPGGVLGAHILHLRVGDGAELPHDGERVLRAIHVDVHADARGASHDRDRISERRERAPDRVAVEPLTRHERFRAVAKEDRLARLADARLDAVLGRFRRRRDGVPRKGRERPFEKDDKAPGARVHDPGAP